MNCIVALMISKEAISTCERVLGRFACLTPTLDRSLHYYIHRIVNVKREIQNNTAG